MNWDHDGLRRYLVEITHFRISLLLLCPLSRLLLPGWSITWTSGHCWGIGKEEGQ
jgi:hypothetical protein